MLLLLNHWAAFAKLVGEVKVVGRKRPEPISDVLIEAGPGYFQVLVCAATVVLW